MFTNNYAHDATWFYLKSQQQRYELTGMTTINGGLVADPSCLIFEAVFSSNSLNPFYLEDIHSYPRDSFHVLHKVYYGMMFQSFWLVPLFSMENHFGSELHLLVPLNRIDTFPVILFE